ncbi:MAG: glycosyltransferase family A protein [Promethearchaeota archaeon]
MSEDQTFEVIGLLDIVIPTKNSDRTLDLCLRGIKSTISYGNVFIVDNFSEDNTKEIALSHGCKYVTSPSKYSLALREGAMMTKGDYFMIVDSDVILNKKANVLFRHMGDYAVIKGVTRHWFRPKFESLTKYWIERMRSEISGLEAALMKKEEFLEYSGDWADNQMDAGGDLNLFYRYKKNNIPMLNLPVVVSTHITGDWKRFWRQAIWYGRSYGNKSYLPIRQTNRNPLKSFVRAVDGGLRYKDIKLFAAIFGNMLCATIGRLTRFASR